MPPVNQMQQSRRCPCGDALPGVKIGLGRPPTSMVLGAVSPSSSLTLGAVCSGALHCRFEHASPPRSVPVGSCGRPAVGIPVVPGRTIAVEEIIEEPAELVERVCALDIGKADAGRVRAGPARDQPGPAPTGGPRVRHHDPFAAGRWRTGLRCQEVTLVAMEATSTYWKPVFYLLEARRSRAGCSTPGDVKNVPGPPKTDKLDAVWLAKVVERGMCGPASCRRRQPRAAGPDPLPAHPGPGADPGEAAAGEAARRRPDQTVGHWSPTCSGYPAGRCWRR